MRRKEKKVMPTGGRSSLGMSLSPVTSAVKEWWARKLSAPGIGPIATLFRSFSASGMANRYTGAFSPSFPMGLECRHLSPVASPPDRRRAYGPRRARIDGRYQAQRKSHTKRFGKKFNMLFAQKVVSAHRHDKESGKNIRGG